MNDEKQNSPSEEQERCAQCNSPGELLGVGSASGRKYYRCANTDCRSEWRGKSPIAAALGSIGGKARARVLSSEERSRIAKIAGEAFAEKMRERRRNQ